MRILCKVGGAQLEQPTPRAELGRALAAARADGHELIVVHGGGNQIRALCRRLGIEDRYHDGLRVTDAATADVVLMVLGGAVNRELVLALQRAGVPAAGLCGADGATFAARRHAPGGRDLGFVGAVDEVDPALVDHLLRGGFTPVIATVAPRPAAPDEPFHNVNADQAAAPLAAAFRCDALLFLTDVAGVLDGSGTRIAELDAAGCAALRADGVIHGGMIPKVEAALAGATHNPGALVKVAPAAAPDAVRAALRPDTGTRFRNSDPRP